MDALRQPLASPTIPAMPPAAPPPAPPAAPPAAPGRSARGPLPEAPPPPATGRPVAQSTPPRSTPPRSTPPQSTPPGLDFEVSTIRLPHGIAKWHLVCDFFMLRKQVFVDEMHWDLHHQDSWEWEQYDSLDAVYVIAHRGDEVLGGARLLRTDREVGMGRLRYSYMIRDAWLGHLPGLPEDLCEEEPPTAPGTWELTRLAVRSARLGAAILDATNAFLKAQAADTCLFLGPPSFMRMARGMGYQPRPMGEVTGNGDGRFLAFSCGVV